MSKVTRTRKELISECSIAVASCWNYYCDKQLSKIDIGNIAIGLEQYLPEEFTTQNHQEIVEDYQKRYGEQEIDKANYSGIGQEFDGAQEKYILSDEEKEALEHYMQRTQ